MPLWNRAAAAALTLALFSVAPAWLNPALAKDVAGSVVAAPVTPHFVAPNALDYDKLLPPPPAPGSLAARADLETVLMVQAWRGPEEIAWAKRIAPANMFIFADVLGPWFRADKLPVTRALIFDVGEDVHEVGEVVKNRYARKRPYQVDPRVKPCVGLPTNDSYPSGHTLRFFVTAEILAEVFPGQREALLELAHRASWGRVLAGVHFPSDVVGAAPVAEAFAAELRKAPAFQARLDAARAELLRAKSAANEQRFPGAN